MPPKTKYVDGEKVLCYHGPLLYEAKCLKIEYKDKAFRYYIHYSGWNKNWDEWVSDSRILKISDANLQKQKELQKMHVKDKKPRGKAAVAAAAIKKEPVEKEIPPPQEKPKARGKAKASSQPVKRELKLTKPPTPPPPPSPKTIPQPERSFMEEAAIESDVKIKLSPFLSDWLLDDWDLVTRQKKLVSLPARLTVDHILASYVKEKVSVKGLSRVKENTIVQVTNRIRDCFNILLGRQLLYKFERPQYAEILTEHKGTSMCQIYGSVHLLRMFSKLGNLLTPLQSVEKITDKGMESLVIHLEDFAKYLSKNKKFFNINDYFVASPVYHRMALFI